MPRPTPLSFRKQYSRIMQGTDQEVDLARAALLISGEIYPDLDMKRYLGLLDSMAEDVLRSTPSSGDPRHTAEALSEYLFRQQGFRGNDEDYYDPRNSYLNQVLDRQLGIPITLSLVYIEVGRRIGLPIEGIGLPGHFVVKVVGASDDLFVDPFNGGRLMASHECVEAVQSMFHGRVSFSPEHLRPYSSRQLLVRLLGNLKIHYLQQNQLRRALASTDLMVITDPTATNNYKDRAAMLAQIGQHGLAVQDLGKYLEIDPEATDAPEVRRQIRTLWHIIAPPN